MKRLIICLLLAGCGSAEAKPYAGGRITIRLAIVGEAFGWCDASEAWVLAHQEMVRVVKGEVPIDLEFDVAMANDRPDLLTVENFWDGSLGGWWRSQIAPRSDSIRWVALPALQGPLYGGMAYGRGLGGWFFTNTEPGHERRNAYTLLHEWAHIWGVPDRCDPNRPAPDLMCAEDYAAFRDGLAPLVYSRIAKRQIRRRLGLKAGKKLVIGRIRERF